MKTNNDLIGRYKQSNFTYELLNGRPFVMVALSPILSHYASLHPFLLPSFLPPFLLSPRQEEGDEEISNGLITTSSKGIFMNRFNMN